MALLTAPLVGISVWSRIRFARSGPSFRCRLRRGSGRGGRPARWHRRCTRALWVNDVLLVQTGVLRLFVVLIHARIVPGAELQLYTEADVRGLGLHPLALRVTGESGPPLEIATAVSDRDSLVGPFLAAAMPGLPRAPRERGG